MANYTTHVKSNRGRTRNCNKCGLPVEAGQSYHTWSFRYGGTYVQHAACGAPRNSDLTQSKMSTVYAALENVEDGQGYDGDTTVEDYAATISGLLTDAAEAVREVVAEYTEAAEPFGQSGENQERADELEPFAEELDDAAGEAEGVEAEEIERDDYDTDEDYEEAVETARTDALDQIDTFANDVTGNCPL